MQQMYSPWQMALESISSQNNAKNPSTHSPWQGFLSEVVLVGDVLVDINNAFKFALLLEVCNSVLKGNELMFILTLVFALKVAFWSLVMKFDSMISVFPYESLDTQHFNPGLHISAALITASQ